MHPVPIVSGLFDEFLTETPPRNQSYQISNPVQTPSPDSKLPMADSLVSLIHLRPHQPQLPIHQPLTTKGSLPSLISAIESSIVWDSVYFVRISECGYEYEQTYAFFPLLPLCMSMLSRTVLAPLVPVIGQRAVLGLSGYVIDNIGFVFAVFAAVYLYRLSVVILDHEAAVRASILFCFNPASIFYSSM